MQLPHENDTIQAVKHIIMAIVEANICEGHGITQAEVTFPRKLPSLKKNKRTIVLLENKNVYVKINLQLKESPNMIETICKLQQEIREEIIHLTGLGVKGIDVCLEKLHVPYK